MAKSISNIINGVPFWYGMGMTVASSIVTGSISFGVGAIANGTLPAVTDRLLHSAAGMLLDQFLPKLSINLGNNFTLSFNMSVMLGHSYGFGLNASLVYDDGNIILAAGYGITKFTNYNGLGINGWEHRFSKLMGYGNSKYFRMSLGLNEFNGYGEMKKFDQTTGLLGINSGDFSFYYENDGAPFNKIPGAENKFNTDMYRTAAASVGIGEFDLSIRMFTGKSGSDQSNIPFNEAIKDPSLVDFDSGREKFNKKTGERTRLGIWKNSEANAYRLGAFTIGYKGLNIGSNSEIFRDCFQNWLAHKIISPQPGFLMLDKKVNFYSQFRNSNIFTLW